MGGFVVTSSEKRLEKALEIYKEKELPLKKTFQVDGLNVAVFRKRAVDPQNIVEFDNGDFVITCGTFVYKEELGDAALKAFYSDFDESMKAIQDITRFMGQYAMVIRKEGQLYFLNDNAGLMRVHYAKEGDDICLSNSFLAVLSMLEKKNISPMEVYEFLFNKAVYGNNTICKEVSLIDSHKVMKLDGAVFKNLHKNIPLSKYKKDESLSYEASLKDMLANVKKYVSFIKKNFDGKISCDLTGGSDTRLMHCLLKNAGAKYGAVTYSVNVDPRCREFPEVKIAKGIAEKEGLDHTIGTPQHEIPNYSQELLKTYYMNDGLLHRLFYEGPQWRKLYETRIKKADVVMHGQGGECFRDRGVLFDSETTMSDYVSDYPYNFVPYDYSYCINFNIQDYKKSIVEKMDLLLEDFVGKPVEKLGVWEKEIMYYETYHKYFGSRKIAWLHQFTYMFDPFIDPQISYPALRVPFEHKKDAKLMEDMMRDLYPVMLEYPQFHGGYSIQDQKNPVKKMVYKAVRKMPYSVIRVARNVNEKMKKKKWTEEYSKETPTHFTAECLNALMDMKNLRMNKFVDINKLDLETTSHLDVLSRIYALELLIQKNNIQV